MRATESDGSVTRGFLGRRTHLDDAFAGRLAPGQYLTDDFPVLTAGPTPDSPLDTWTFAITGEVDEPLTWSWPEFQELPAEEITCDIHCVTGWSKFDTRWRGVAVDSLLAGVETAADHVLAHCNGGYSTNLPLEDLVDGRAWVVYEYDESPLTREHGAPARLLVPHLYFWKSAKWIRGLELLAENLPGFWESLGYHDYGDPWLEQRYEGD